MLPSSASPPFDGGSSPEFASIYARSAATRSANGTTVTNSRGAFPEGASQPGSTALIAACTSELRCPMANAARWLVIQC